MKFKWETNGIDDSDHDLLAKIDDVWKLVGYVHKIGGWWEIAAYFAEDEHTPPDGARFESLHAAKIYLRKHALVAIIGGYKT